MYKKAIDILTMDNVDLKKIAIEIAKSNPSIFVKAYYTANGMKCPNTLIGKCRNLDIDEKTLIKIFESYGDRKWLPEYLKLCFTKCEPRQAINGIKHIRAIDGIGLREAKHISDNIIRMVDLEQFYS